MSNLLRIIFFGFICMEYGRLDQHGFGVLNIAFCLLLGQYASWYILSRMEHR